MHGVDDKRKYLIEKEAEDAPKLLRPLLRFRWIRSLWRRRCFHKVTKLTEGEVLMMYYKCTGKTSEVR